jgi:hypothetical protein
MMLPRILFTVLSSITDNNRCISLPINEITNAIAANANTNDNTLARLGDSSINLLSSGRMYAASFPPKIADSNIIAKPTSC